MIRLSPELMRDLAGVRGAALSPIVLPTPEGAARERLNQLFTDAFSGFAEGANDLEQEAKLAAIARTLLTSQAGPRQKAATPRVVHAVEVVKTYLTENPIAPVSLNALSELTGMSKFHLSRKFKVSVGVTPSAFSMSLRVNQAKALLLQGEPIAHVAVDLGFADQAHLARNFRRYVGVTPGQL